MLFHSNLTETEEATTVLAANSFVSMEEVVGQEGLTMFV